MKQKSLHGGSEMGHPVAIVIPPMRERAAHEWGTRLSMLLVSCLESIAGTRFWFRFLRTRSSRLRGQWSLSLYRIS